MDIPSIETLGKVHDFKGGPRPVERAYEGLNLAHVSMLQPAGVRELEQQVAAYWTSLARWRAASIDLASYGIDLGDCRETLATLPGTGDPSDFTSTDWHEVGQRLSGLRQFGGYTELSRLHALLTCDDPEAFRG